MFLAPNFFRGRAPELLDLHYKEHRHCDHVAKFHGDRPTELGDRVAKEIKLEIWGRAQREAARGVRKQALINF